MGIIPPINLVSPTMDIKQKIIDYVSENIIKASSFIFFLFGGLVFFIYYLDIKYLPDLNLINSVQLLAFASLTGILLILSTIAMLVFPGIFWHKSIYENEVIANIWSNKFWRIIAIFVIPIIGIYVSVIAFIYFNIMWILFSNLLWILVLYFYGFSKIKSLNISFKQFSWNYFKILGFSASVSIVSVLPIFLLAFIFLDEYKQDIKDFAIGCIALTIYIIISNIIVIIKPDNVNSIYWYFTLGLMSFLTVNVFTSQAATFTKAIMKTYKLGNIEASSVVLDKKGCSIVKNNTEIRDGDIKYKDKIYSINTDKEICSIPNIKILSRLGKESYLEMKIDVTIEAKNNTVEKIIRFTIPSESIMSFSIDSNIRK